MNKLIKCLLLIQYETPESNKATIQWVEHNLVKGIILGIAKNRDIPLDEIDNYVELYNTGDADRIPNSYFLNN